MIRALSPSPLVAATLLAIATSASAIKVTYRTPEQIVIGEDFNGDGGPDIAVIDRASGYFRIGFVGGAGYQWTRPLASGSQHISDAGAGDVVGSGAAELLVSSPTANRIQVIRDLKPSTDFTTPAADYLAGPGPNGVAVWNATGSSKDSVVAGSIYGQSGTASLTARKGDANTLFTSSATAHPSVRAFNPVETSPGATTRLAYFAVVTPSDDRLVVADVNGGGITTWDSSGLVKAGSEMVYGEFETGQHDLLVYHHESIEVSVYRGGPAGLAPVTVAPLPAPPRLLVPTADRILALYENGGADILHAHPDI